MGLCAIVCLQRNFEPPIHPSVVLCALACLQRDFEPVVVQQQGWVFKNEQPKALYIQGEK